MDWSRLAARCSPHHSLIPLQQCPSRKEDGKVWKLVGQDKDGDIIYQLLTWLEKNYSNSLPNKNRIGYWETNRKLKPPSSMPLYFSGWTLLLQSRLLSTPEQHRGMGNGIFGHFITVHLCPPSSSHLSPAPVQTPHKPQVLPVSFSTIAFSRGCWGISDLMCGAAPPLLPSLTSVLTGLFLTFFSSFLTACAAFYLFLYIFPQGTTSSAGGLSCSLQWVSWSWPCPAQGSPGLSSQRPKSGHLHPYTG